MCYTLFSSLRFVLRVLRVVRMCALGLELPEALRFVDRGVVDRTAALLHKGMVDVAERVIALAVVRLVCVAPAAELHGEQLLARGDRGLADHRLHGRGDGPRLDRVDLAKRESEEAVAAARGELLRHGVRELDGLVREL